MIDIEKLKRSVTAIVAELRALTEGVPEGERMSEKDATTWNQKEVELKAVQAEIKRAITLNNIEAGDAEADKGAGAGADEAPEDRNGFATSGEFLTAVRLAATPGAEYDERLKYVGPAHLRRSKGTSGKEARAATGQNVGIATEGGFLTQQQMLDEFFMHTYENAVIADACARVSIGDGFNGIRMNGLDESSRADGERWGGIRAYWAAEAATSNATKMKFHQIKMDLEKLLCFVYATDENLEDAQQLEGIVNNVVPKEIAFQLDQAIVSGSGAGQPSGILGAKATVSVPKEAGQAAATVVYENIVKMRARLKASLRPGARWLINQDIEPELHTMAFVVGAGGIPVYLPANGVSGKPFDTLYGMDIVPVEHCPTLGTVGDIILFQPSQYLLIDKGGIKNAASMHVRFLYEEKIFRFTMRVNGQLLWHKALTPKNSTKTQSPVITLATRG